ncbi:hypothetical protein CRA86_08620, partial [Campylobacter coli]|nr:hypothetical protein [Campylobacter coli]
KVFFKLKNKTKTINFKTIFKKFTLFLLPVYLLLFLVGGCSYKYMDPQYYEFRSLCKDIDNKVIIYNKAYWEIFSNREKGNTMHDEKGEFFFNQKINKKNIF